MELRIIYGNSDAAIAGSFRTNQSTPLKPSVEEYLETVLAISLINTISLIRE